MPMKREEILEELEHQQTLSNALRKRLRALELQRAQHGNSTPPQIVTEIVSLTEELRRCQNEIRELRTVIGEEDEATLTELRYQQALLSTWSLRLGRSRPLLREINDLELQRRRLGITLDRANQLEIEIRNRLVEEVFFNMDHRHTYWLARAFGVEVEKDSANLFEDIPEAIKPYLDEDIMMLVKYKGTSINEQLEYIGIGVRLNYSRTIELLLPMIPKNVSLNVDFFEFCVSKINKTWIFREDKTIFADFFSGLRGHLKNRQQIT